MDERAKACIEFVLKHEGGYVNHPEDPGGATDYGISLRYLRTLGVIDPDDGFLLGDMDRDGDIDIIDIQKLTLDEATKIYKTQWWDRYFYGQIGHLPLAAKVFDFAVNAGQMRAGLTLQSVLNKHFGLRLKEDGAIDLMTLTAANGCTDQRLLVASFKLAMIEFYAGLKKIAFLSGWVNRALDDFKE